MPIEILVEWIFYFFRSKLAFVGVIGAVLGVSFCINFLALPLYNMADALKEKDRDLLKKLQPKINRIKKAFSGDEQFMMISTLYRQNNYSPIYAFRSSLSILLEIPFFIAAYHFLSNCSALLGQSFWIFSDLSKPDSLFSINLSGIKLVINVLPFLMTLINLFSGIIYSKGAPVKEKIQLFGLTAIFLILLYNSPSGLVIYWIFNNLFSLAKNIVQKSKYSFQIVFLFFVFCLIFGTIFIFIKRSDLGFAKLSFLVIFDLIFISFPFLKSLYNKTKFSKKIESIIFKNENLNLQDSKKIKNQNFLIFLFSCINLALLLGFVLPTSVISTSPMEFSFLGNTKSPINYIYFMFLFYTGFCFVWPFIIYKISSEKTKNILSILFLTLLVCAILNCFVFKSDYGTLNFSFEIKNNISNVSKIFILLPLDLPIIVFALILICKKSSIYKHFSLVLISVCVAQIFYSASKIPFINSEYKILEKQKETGAKFENAINIKPIFHLSKENKNVVVLFLDRAINSFVPYIMEQFDSLPDDYDGFTYFPNCVSFGDFTNISTPSMLGGYEYTPDNINLRKNELLVDKHNESILVMPKLFSLADFQVAVSSVPWPNYAWSGESGPFDKENIPVVSSVGVCTSSYYKEFIGEVVSIGDKLCQKGMLNFSMIQSLLPIFRGSFYRIYEKLLEDAMTVTSFYSSVAPNYYANFSTLYYLKNLTDFSSNKNTYTFIGNEVTHSEIFLQSPDYLVEGNGEDKYCGNFNAKTDYEVKHYQINAATLKILPKWFEYLKENNCYDNTRIIIVSDHGRNLDLETFDNFVGEKENIPEWFNCLFLVKDFNSRGKIKTDNSFMTNADTLFFAKKDLNISNINPYTKKEFVQEKDKEITLHKVDDWNATAQKLKKTFSYSSSWKVKDNIFNPDNWTKAD